MGTLSIGGNLSINGTAGSGCTWADADIDQLTGTGSASYATVTNSTNSSGTEIDATDNCIDGGGNTGWNFAASGQADVDKLLAYAVVGAADDQSAVGKLVAYAVTGAANDQSAANKVLLYAVEGPPLSTPTIFLGSAPIAELKLGSSDILEVYLGSQKIWPV